jgi:ABC-2 type transport system permease protein
MSEIVARERAQRLGELELEPVGPQRGAVTGTIAAARDVWRHRELLDLLIRRELRARYKNSVLGLVWSLLKPITQLLIYYFVIGEFLGMARNLPDFAIYIFTGLTAWALFNEIVGGGTGSIVSNSGLIKKIYVPREIFPYSAIGAAIFNFGIQFAILAVATVVLRKPPTWDGLVYLPLALATLLVFGSALALLLSALNVYLRDVQHIVEIITMILFWASPVIYGLEQVRATFGGSWLEQVYLSNPITLAIVGFHRAMWSSGPDTAFPDDLALRLTIALLASCVLFWVSQRVFSRLEGNFAQEL